MALMKPVGKKVFAVLQAMVDKLNEEHDRWCVNASPEEMAQLHTESHVSPRFKLEAVAEDEIEDYNANVALHDDEAEESEYGTPEYIALEILSIRYFSGYHKWSTGI